jgi:hypothetical protein
MTPNGSKTQVRELPKTQTSRASTCVLLSFLEFGDRLSSVMTRKQITALRGVLRVYPATSLKVFALALARRGFPNHGTSDLARLGAIPLLPDVEGFVAARYDVTCGPTTLLLEQGRLVARWDGFAPAANLEPAVRELLEHTRATSIRPGYDDGL